MVDDRGIQLNRCAKHLSTRELISSDSESKGGSGCPKFCLDFIGELFNNRPMRLLLPACWSDRSAEGAEVNIDNELDPETVGLELLAGDIPWVGEGGGVTVVASRRCFSKTLSNKWVSKERMPGTSLSNSLCTSVFLAILKSSLGEANSSDVVWSMSKPNATVEGCWSNWKNEYLSIAGYKEQFWVSLKNLKPCKLWFVVKCLVYQAPQNLLAMYFVC